MTTTKLLTGTAVLLALGTMASADTIRFWTTEEQPERLARQEALAEQFEAATGHTVEVIPVTETDMGTRTTAAFAAGDLPDVIYHPAAIRPALGRGRHSGHRGCIRCCRRFGCRHLRAGCVEHGGL